MSYTGIVLQSKQIQLVEPEFDNERMISADSVTCTLVGSQGSTISVTAMEYTANLPETDTWGWFANVNMPSALQVIDVKVEALRSGARGRWAARIRLKKF